MIPPKGEKPEKKAKYTSELLHLLKVKKVPSPLSF